MHFLDGKISLFYDDLNFLCNFWKIFIKIYKILALFLYFLSPILYNILIFPIKIQKLFKQSKNIYISKNSLFDKIFES